MINIIEEIIDYPRKPGEYKKLGIILGIVSTGLSIVLIFRQNQIFWVFDLIALCLFAVSLIYPLLLKPIYILWWIVSRIIGFIISQLLLVVVFYLLITPLGLLSRRLAKLKYSSFKLMKNCDSYWLKKVPEQSDKNQYERQY